MIPNKHIIFQLCDSSLEIIDQRVHMYTINAALRLPMFVAGVRNTLIIIS